MAGMSLRVRSSDLAEIAPLRLEYRTAMNCQIIHDSIHERPGWTEEYALEVGGAVIGYGSLAVAGPWSETPALYEFYIRRDYRSRLFEFFEALAAASGAEQIETQTNDRTLAAMLHTYCTNIRAEAILFEDMFQTSYSPAGASVRASGAGDSGALLRWDLDGGAGWVLTVGGEIAGAGGVLYHYNRPYGDVYMKIAEPFRRKGLGSYLVQELKAACRAGGSVPAARCRVDNISSRRTLQKAGFVPCGNLIVGELGTKRAA